VSNHVFDCAAQQRGTAEHDEVFRDRHLDTSVTALNFKFGIGRNFGNEFFQMDGGPLYAFFSALQPGNGKQPANQLVEPIGFEIDSLQRALGVRSTTLTS